MNEGASRGPITLVIMGVAGCGKSTVGARVAQELGYKFLDADDVHPEHNLALMAARELPPGAARSRRACARVTVGVDGDVAEQGRTLDGTAAVQNLVTQIVAYVVART